MTTSSKILTKNLTGIRGFAVLLVFSAHTPIRHIIGDFGQQAVYIFFFLSAYLLTISLDKQTISKFYSKRFWRIYPLYGILILIFGILYKFSLIDIIRNLLFLQQTNNHFILDVSWSLIIEVELYICLPFIVYFLKKFKMKFLIFIILITYLIRFSLFDLYLIHVQNGSMKVVFGYLFEFLDIFTISAYISLNKHKIKSLILHKNLEKILQFIVVTLFLILPLTLELLHINRALSIIVLIIPIYTILISFIFTFLIRFSNPINSFFNSKILNFYGNISYSFYLLHIPILTFFKTLPIPLIFQGILSFIFITTISYISYLYIEQKFIK